MNTLSHIDGEGNIIEDSSPDLQTIWAKILLSKAKNTYGNFEKVQEITYYIIVRFSIIVRVTDKILWNGKTLEIITPPCMLEGNRRFWVIETPR